MKNVSPVLLVLLGLLAGYPAVRLATAPAADTKKAEAPKSADKSANSSTPAPPDPAPAVQESCSSKDKNSPPPSWCEPVRVLREFFGLPNDPGKPRDASLNEVVLAARTAGYDLRFLVALVPAPPDPRLDQALDAIQEGFADAKYDQNAPHRPGPPTPDDYLIDRMWLPTTGAEAAPWTTSPQSPGIMLFRGTYPNSLEVVLLVPESLKRGIQKDAFLEALDLANGLHGASVEDRVSILGPSFSGSAESLRLALLRWQESRGGPLKFQVASGSATAQGVGEVFAAMDDVPFCRTVLPDEALKDAAFTFLRDEMGWDLRKVALLTEADTAYGQGSIALRKGPRRKKDKKEDKKEREKEDEKEKKRWSRIYGGLVLVPFPSHISDVRNAVETEEEKSQKAAALENPLQTNRPGLDLSLTGGEQDPDLVPTFSTLTTQSNDLMLSNLLGTISREGIRYVGILATDVKDKIFLAEEVRDFAPDVVLFTFDNNLLYAHPQYTQTMDGMLVFSSSPLFTQGAPGLPGSAESYWTSQRRQRSSEFQEGIVKAVKHLLGAGPVPAPQAWIAAVGNGSLWPVARLRMEPASLDGAQLCDAAAPRRVPLRSALDMRRGTGFSAKDDLEILLVAVILGLLAASLSRTALLDGIPGSPKESSVVGNRRLLVLGAVLLAAAAGFLLAVGGIPWWARLFTSAAPQATGDPAQWAFLLALAAAYGALVYNAARAAHGNRISLWGVTAWALGGLLALVLIVLGVRWLCVPGSQIQLFHLRARALASGLSPLIPLSLIGGAVYVWLWNELSRRRLMARLAVDCPLEALCEPVLSGCDPILESFRGLLTRTLPEGPSPWLLPLIAFGPPVLLLWGTVQPIGEGKGFGRFFILFLALSLALSALSFYRFVRVWRGTLRLLHRLDNASPAVAKAFEAISPDLEWRPIKSFGWQMPPFRSLILSANKLRELVAAGRATIENWPESLDAPLKAMFENERDGGSAQEIENRNRIERIFAQACRDLRGQVKDPEVKKFLALRVAAYLRYLFAHLRSCLIGALTSALLALLGITAYAFAPKHFVSLAGWVAVGVAVVLTLWIFLQMDRNPTLSRIGGTTPGKVTLDRVFLTKLFTYVGIPILGLVATQFPAVGQLLSRVAGQVLRVVGGG